MKIILRPVSEKDYPFLYELLKQKEKKECISHKEMPSYVKHLKFCRSKPYKNWLIVLNGDIPIGKVYISKLDEISIQVLKGYEYVKAVLLDKFHPKYANISPEDKLMQKILEKKGFKLIQHTYESLL